MEKLEVRQILAGVSLAALLAGVAVTGCASADTSSGGQKGGAPPQTQPQGGGMSGCGGASGCGGKKQ